MLKMNPSRNVFVFSANSPRSYGISGVNIVEISLKSKYRTLLEYQKFNEVVESEDSKNLFIDTDRYDNLIEFRVMNSSAPGDSIFVKTEDVRKTIEDFKNNKLKPSYDILAGQNMDSLSQRERRQAKAYMADLMYRMLVYKSAGYDKYENREKIEDWCICFYDPIMLYFVNYFGIHTQSEDISIVDEFLTNPQFRHMITIELMKVSAHFAVNNNLVDLSKVKSWIDYDYQGWMDIYDKIN
jgi:hypothetical protein